MPIIRLEDFTDPQLTTARQHLLEVEEVTPGPRLVDLATGEARPAPVHHLLVPSHASQPDPRFRWQLRLSWHPQVVRGWHHGQRDSDGQPVDCLAYQIDRRCWHLAAGLLWVAHHWHDDQLPGQPGRGASSPAPRPARALAGFYD